MNRVEDLEELAPLDDAIIGRVFRISVIVATVIAALAGLYFVTASRARETPTTSLRVRGPSFPPVTTSQVPAAVFTNVTREAGINFDRVDGAYGDKLLPEALGGGVAFLDYDNDGRPDLLFTNGAYWPVAEPPGARPTLRLFHNEGAGRFRDATHEAGLDTTFYGMGLAVGDYDNDGWSDVFITAVGENHLFRNDRGKFRDITGAAGVAGPASAWSTSAAWIDVDGDGRLDLFVCRYVSWSEKIDRQLDVRLDGYVRRYPGAEIYEASDDVLFHNNGDGTFTDISAKSGVQVRDPYTRRPVAKSLGVTVTDIDGDGRADLVVTNDTTANFVFRNRGDGTFEDAGAVSGVAYGSAGQAKSCAGIDAAQAANDGRLYLVAGCVAGQSASLWVGAPSPHPLFVECARAEGLGSTTSRASTFGTLFVDYDLDGRLDLLQANGHVEDEIAKLQTTESYEQSPSLYWNSGAHPSPRFVRVPPAQSRDLAIPLVARGVAYADIDGDGDLDLVFAQANGTPLLLRNDTPSKHHWLRMRLMGNPQKHSNRDAIGAEVELIANGNVQRRMVTPSHGYLSQVESTLTFGLGAAERVGSLRIRWPNGERETIDSPAVDRLLVIEQK